MNESGIDINQQLSLRKGDIEKKVVVTGELANREQMGGAYRKSKVEVKTLEGSERPMRLVIKEVKRYEPYQFPSEANFSTPAERYVEKWRVLREAGIPTVGSMRVTDDMDVVMGDMTSDGGKFLGKEAGLKSLVWGELAKRKLEPEEETFLNIDDNKLRSAIKDLHELAWKKGIMLPQDDPFDVLVKPDGSWKAIVLDLSGVRLRESDETEEDLADVVKESYEEIDRIKTYLKKVKE